MRTSVSSRIVAAAPLAALTLVTFVVYAGYSINRFWRYSPSGYDLAIFDQAVRNYSRFRAPLVAMKGADFNLLGDHFHPILALLAPLYWIFDDPRMLLLAQAALIAVSVPVIYRFAARRMSAPLALTVAAGYALGWPLQAMARSDFHEIAFAVPLLAWAIDSLDRREDKQLLLSCGLLLGVREDLGLVVAILGGLRIGWQSRRLRRPRRIGLLLVAGGLLTYWLATHVLIPHFASSGRFAYWNYGALGPDPGAAVRFLVVHPLRSARLFFTPVTKLHTMLWLLTPLGFLCLRSRYAVLALPLAGALFFSARRELWTTQYHYPSLLWVVLMFAAIDGAHRLGVRAALRYWPFLPLMFAIVATLSDGTVFALHDLLDRSSYVQTSHARAQQAAIGLIPGSVCVATDDRMAAHLSSKDLVSLPTRLARPPDFILLDLSRDVMGYQVPTPQQVLAQAIQRGDGVIFSRVDVVLLRSPAYSGPSTACRAQ